jgi:integrase
VLLGLADNFPHVIDAELFGNIKTRLGHSSIAITLDIYSHLMPNMQEGAAATVVRRVAEI